jgi:hypothetical protein
MVFYRGSNIAHNGSADWCSSQVPTYELRRAIFLLGPRELPAQLGNETC